MKFDGEPPIGHSPVTFFWSREDVDNECTYRASGDVVCEHCGRLYFDHPFALERWNLSFTGDPFLHRLCDGSLVKL
jgi:hypothetical protein